MCSFLSAMWEFVGFSTPSARESQQLFLVVIMDCFWLAGDNRLGVVNDRLMYFFERIYIPSRETR